MLTGTEAFTEHPSSWWSFLSNKTLPFSSFLVNGFTFFFLYNTVSSLSMVLNYSIAINGTSESENPYFPFDNPLPKGAKTAAHVPLLLLTLVGNVIVIHIIRRNPTLRSTVDLLIVNMCVSDVFISFLALPSRIKEIYVDTEWIGGDLGSILCKLVHFAMDVTTAVSILSNCLSLQSRGLILCCCLPHKNNTYYIFKKSLNCCPYLGIASTKLLCLFLHLFQPRNWNQDTLFCKMVPR